MGGLRLIFMPNVPGATFIPGATSIPESRVNKLEREFDLQA